MGSDTVSRYCQNQAELQDPLLMPAGVCVVRVEKPTRVLGTRGEMLYQM